MSTVTGARPTKKFGKSGNSATNAASTGIPDCRLAPQARRLGGCELKHSLYASFTSPMSRNTCRKYRTAETIAVFFNVGLGQDLVRFVEKFRAVRQPSRLRPEICLRGEFPLKRFREFYLNKMTAELNGTLGFVPMNFMGASVPTNKCCRQSSTAFFISFCWAVHSTR